MEGKLVIGNFKMNQTITEVKEYIKVIENKINDQVIVCPSLIYVPYFLNKSFNVGIQNIHYENKGAFTGEISPSQVKSLGIKKVLIGHSERRLYFDEDKIVNKKIISALTNELEPILCIGEDILEFEQEKTKNVLVEQLDEAFKDIEGYLLKNIIVAYEPIWAIGTGKIPTPKEIKNNITHIKDYLKSKYNLETKVLYGGSVTSGNINSIIDIEEVDGVLVGSASLDPEEFSKIIEVVVNR